jgi:hypothetical protein
MLELQKRINDAIFNFEILKTNLEKDLFSLVSLFSQINLRELQWEPPAIQLYEIDRNKSITFHLPNESYFEAMVSFHTDINYEMIIQRDLNLVKIHAFPQTTLLSFLTTITDSPTNDRIIKILLSKNLYTRGLTKVEVEIDITITVSQLTFASALNNISTHPTFTINEYTNSKTWSYSQLHDMIAYIMERLLKKYSFKFTFYAETISKLMKTLLNELPKYLKKSVEKIAR